MEKRNQKYYFLTIGTLVIFIIFCSLFVFFKNDLLKSTEVSSVNKSEVYFQYGLKQLWLNSSKYFFLLILLCIMKPTPLGIIINVAIFTIAHTLSAYFGFGSFSDTPHPAIYLTGLVLILYLVMSNSFGNNFRPVRVVPAILGGVVVGCLFPLEFQKMEITKSNIFEALLISNLAIILILSLCLFCIYFFMLRWVAKRPIYANVIAIPLSATIGVITLITATNYLLN